MIGGATMPVLEFKAKMRGMPARILVFRDRIEWMSHSKAGRLQEAVRQLRAPAPPAAR